jgi:hypothetical protein
MDGSSPELETVDAWERGEAAWFEREELRTLYRTARTIREHRAAHLLTYEGKLVQFAMRGRVLRDELMAACELEEHLARRLGVAA